MRNERPSKIATRSIVIFSILTGILFAFNSCKKECNDPSNPECKNYDPCYGKEHTQASFSILLSKNTFWDPWPEAPVDSVVLGAYYPVKFTSTASPNSKLTWILGLDTFESPSVTTHFGGLPYGSYPVTLIAKRELDTLCFPDDDGIDVYTKNMYVVPICQLNVIGKYRGILDGQKDSIDIAIETINPNIPSDTCSTIIRLSNLFGKGDTLWMDLYYISNNTLSMWDPTPELQKFDIAFNQQTGLFEIDFIEKFTLIAHQFIGRKE